MKSFKLVYIDFFTLLILASLLTTSAHAEMSQTANALAIKPGQPAQIYAGTSDGLFLNENGKWMTSGFNENNIVDVVIHPVNPELMYVIADEGVLYKITSSGKDWSKVPVRVNSSEFELRTLAVSISDESLLVAGSEDGHLLKSNDAGRSWSIINPDFPLTAINSIALHPRNSDTLFVGTGGNGVFKSTNGGKAWTILNEGLTDTTVTRLLIDPANESILFAGTYGGGVFKSTDGAKSWKEVNHGLSDTFVYSLTLSPSKSGKSGMMGFLTGGGNESAEIYAGVYGGGIYRSSVKGDIDWQPL